ncbi:MAG: leucyl aminopeptidase [Actinomycetota bacterium]|nr:leucyl aminopeptidase [Actinomycetota bacterium]
MPAPRLRLVTALPVGTDQSQAVAVPVRRSEEGPQPDLAGAPGLDGLDPADVGRHLEREKVTGEAGEVLAVPLVGAGPELLLLVGTGDGSPAALRRAGAALARRARAVATVSTTLLLGVDAAGTRAFAEGLLLASYAFSQKREPKAPALRSVDAAVTARTRERQQAGLELALATAAATTLARDLVNTPSYVKTPAWLARQARGLGGPRRGLAVRVREPAELAAGGFGGILAVGAGSTRGPRLIELSYSPAGARRHVVLVGKGITFDSGGLSLKPPEGMPAMKTDMAGGAAVLAVLSALPALGLPVRVTGLVPAAENMPSGTAQRPGDVITQYGGTTVEVLNTDAEGRLVLADALAYAAAELAPDVLVDIATLTGAMPIALGRRTAGLFSSDDRLADQLLAAGAEAGERVWRMPLVEDYRDALDSPVADLANIGRTYQGGSITAALFLREFACGLPWAHLDIAGPARADADDDEVCKGGTGYGVRLLLRWLEALAPARRSARKTA